MFGSDSTNTNVRTFKVHSIVKKITMKLITVYQRTNVSILFLGTSKPSDASVTPVLAIALPVAAALILILMFVLYFRFYRRRRTHEITRTDFVHMGEVSSVR